MKKGKLIIFSAPSGAGKTTIVQHLLKTFPDKIAFSISATTRQARGGEQHNEDYYFISKDEFLHKIEKLIIHYFLLKIFHDNYL